MHLRKKKRARVALPSPELDGDLADFTADLAAGGPSPEEAVSAHEALQVAGRRLDALGDKYGSIFRMRFADGYSEAEIANELDLNVATVKTRAYRARAALRAELETALA
jgi:RNA polymerase sigma-70 factor (ECF subfamily)